MIKFIRKNNKQVLAIFGVFLMIAFVVQTRYNPSGSDRAARAIGRIGDQTVTEGELESVHQQWKLLRQALVVEYPPHSGEYRSLVGLQLGEAAQAIDQTPRLYLLLIKEADRAGVGVSDKEVDNVLNEPSVNVQTPAGSITRYDQLQSLDPDYAGDVREATTQLLRVMQSSNAGLDLVKVSRPQKAASLAADHQDIAVRLVQIDSKAFAGKIAPPTTQDLQKQFDQFANVPPAGTAIPGNPLGVGYQVPDQVRLQTISVSRKALRAAVEKSKSAYEWEVLERSYYLKHKSEYATTQPLAPPPDAMMTVPATQMAATLPFEKVRAKIADAVREPQVNDLHDRVEKEIANLLQADWASYHAAHPTTLATTAAASTQPTGSAERSSLGVAYGGYEYLQALAAKVQTDLGVLPETQSLGQPLSEAQLIKQPGIGTAHVVGGPTTFAAAAMDASTPILQPSAALEDDDGNVYFFRVTDRIAAHAPASMSEVGPALATDWIRARQYDAALKQAKTVCEAAKKVGLTKAASDAGLSMSQTPPFSPALYKAADPIEGVSLRGDDQYAFRERCLSIIDAAARHEPPVAVVEAPVELKAMVIELAEVRPDWPDGERYVAEGQVTQELIREFARPIESEWFSLKSVETRLGYVSTEPEKTAG
jgi:hypothetical protein